MSYVSLTSKETVKDVLYLRTERIYECENVVVYNRKNST